MAESGEPAPRLSVHLLPSATRVFHVDYLERFDIWRLSDVTCRGGKQLSAVCRSWMFWQFDIMSW